MSGIPRVRLNPPPCSGKQGPMRATVPVALMRQGSSPTQTSSGTKATICYDGHQSPESKWSPGTKVTCIGKTRLLRRAASLDSIYLSGQWDVQSYCGRPMVERATQTPEDWKEMERLKKKDSLEMKYIRQKLQRTSPRWSPVQGDHHLPLCTGPITIPASHSEPRTIPLVPRMHNSVEGLNQEIERLVFSGNELERVMGPTPEGHRAPIAELFHSTCSVDTQTSCTDDSLFPQATSPECNKSGSSPEYEGNKLGSSPQINKFLAREPPDGCEKVRIIDEARKPSSEEHIDNMPKPSSQFVLRPSQRSAFCPLDGVAPFDRLSS
ncbi:protein FAM117A-like isoform X2 [Ornithodoros turicata]|uniref:protein FAM117A-like isoform X2 n=1 Tax=Ornithodoros turicata TaxID=34597 RepID=UPI00313936CC